MSNAERFFSPEEMAKQSRKIEKLNLDLEQIKKDATKVNKLTFENFFNIIKAKHDTINDSVSKISAQIEEYLDMLQKQKKKADDHKLPQNDPYIYAMNTSILINKNYYNEFMEMTKLIELLNILINTMQEIISKDTQNDIQLHNSNLTVENLRRELSKDDAELKDLRQKNTDLQIKIIEAKQEGMNYIIEQMRGPKVDKEAEYKNENAQLKEELSRLKTKKKKDKEEDVVVEGEV